VECKACGSIHKYRDAPAPQKDQKAAARSNPARREGRTAADARKDTAAFPAPASPGQRRRGAGKREDAWEEAMRRHDGEPARPYSMQSAYQPHTLLLHPLFGQGEILDVTRPDKMSVLFREGVKILRCKLS
jgi:hypothetical protein